MFIVRPTSEINPAAAAMESWAPDRLLVVAFSFHADVLLSISFHGKPARPALVCSQPFHFVKDIGVTGNGDVCRRAPILFVKSVPAIARWRYRDRVQLPTEPTDVETLHEDAVPTVL